MEQQGSLRAEKGTRQGAEDEEWDEGRRWICWVLIAIVKSMVLLWVRRGTSWDMLSKALTWCNLDFSRTNWKVRGGGSIEASAIFLVKDGGQGDKARSELSRGCKWKDKSDRNSEFARACRKWLVSRMTPEFFCHELLRKEWGCQF